MGHPTPSSLLGRREVWISLPDNSISLHPSGCPGEVLHPFRLDATTVPDLCFAVMDLDRVSQFISHNGVGFCDPVWFRCGNDVFPNPCGWGAVVRYTFIQIAKKKKTHPKTLSSKTISSKREDNFIPDIFIQKRVHPMTRVRPMTLSSKNGFVQ